MIFQMYTYESRRTKKMVFPIIVCVVLPLSCVCGLSTATNPLLSNFLCSEKKSKGRDFFFASKWRKIFLHVAKQSCTFKQRRTVLDLSGIFRRWRRQHPPYQLLLPPSRPGPSRLSSTQSREYQLQRPCVRCGRYLRSLWSVPSACGPSDPHPSWEHVLSPCVFTVCGVWLPESNTCLLCSEGTTRLWRLPRSWSGIDDYILPCPLQVRA